MSIAWIALPLLQFACFQPAPDEVAPPKSAPPEMAVVYAVPADGALELLRTVQKAVTVQKERPVKTFQNGEETTKMETYTVTKMVSECYAMKADLAKGRAQTADGQPLTAADAAKRLKKGDTILLAYSDEVDPAWLRPVKPETVVLLLPPAAPTPAVPVPVAPMPAAPMPAGSPRPGPAPAPLPPARVKEPAPAAPADGKKSALFSAIEEELLALHNAERKQAGLAPLKLSLLLTKAARKHTDNMAAKDSLQHDLDGQGPAQRVSAMGYSWSRVGENIAHGQRTPAEAMRSWMNSAGHKENILTGTYTELGVARANGKDGRPYWTAVFAAPR